MNAIKKFWFLLLLIGISLASQGQTSFSDALEDVFFLRFQSIDKLQNGETKHSLTEVERAYVQSYAELLHLAFEQDKQVFEHFFDAYDERIDRVEEHISEDSPEYLFYLSELNFHMAVVRVLHGDYIRGSIYFYRSNKQVQENLKLFPEYKLSLKLKSLFTIAFGILPSSYQNPLRLFGLDGDIESGLKDLELYRKEVKKGARELEALILYAVVKRQFASKKTLPAEISSWLHNPLVRYFQVQVYTEERKLDSLVNMLDTYPQQSDAFRIPLFDFRKAKAKLALEQSGVDTSFQEFLKHTKGDNYIKATWYYLSLYYYQQGDKTAFEAAINNLQTQGADKTDVDRFASSMYQGWEAINTQLLKVRFCFDRGDFACADSLLNSESLQLKNDRDTLEYLYRKGRVAEERRMYEEASTYYQRAVKEGRELDFYFAANAALRLGIMAEKEKEYPLAKHYYKDCLDIEPAGYKEGIHQKAKSGLIRIEKAAKQ